MVYVNVSEFENKYNNGKNFECHNLNDVIKFFNLNDIEIKSISIKPFNNYFKENEIVFQYFLNKDDIIIDVSNFSTKYGMSNAIVDKYNRNISSIIRDTIEKEINKDIYFFNIYYLFNSLSNKNNKYLQLQTSQDIVKIEKTNKEEYEKKINFLIKKHKDELKDLDDNALLIKLSSLYNLKIFGTVQSYKIISLIFENNKNIQIEFEEKNKKRFFFF